MRGSGYDITARRFGPIIWFRLMEGPKFIRSFSDFRTFSVFAPTAHIRGVDSSTRRPPPTFPFRNPYFSRILANSLIFGNVA